MSKQSIGFVVINDHGRPVGTGRSWGNKIPKLYSKLGTAKAIATTHGGSVFEAFVDFGTIPFYVAPIAPGKVPYGD